MKNISFRNDVLPLKDALYRLALRITLSHEEAQDIVQDTLIKVWDKRESWNEIESIEAFSITICRNLALDRIKKHDNLNDSLEERQTESPDTSLTPFEDTLQQDRIELVRNLVNALPEKQRSCMQLRDFEGKPYKEIAKILGISEEQVKVNIFRARQTVKERFQKYDNYGL
ncbi:MAG: RNA polymerase sigma factor [Hoylesella buccalis]